MQITTIQINALAAIIMLGLIAVMLIWRGDYCAGVGVASPIGVVATYFAKNNNGN